MSLCLWVLPGKVHRRRLPLPQTNLGSVQTGFPRRPGPEPKHTSASGTVARNNIMFLHPRFQKSYSWAAWFCHSLNVEWCSLLWRGNLKKPLTIFEAECFLKPDVAQEHTDKHLMAGPPLLLARHSPGCYSRPSWWKASGDRSCQAKDEDLSSLVGTSFLKLLSGTRRPEWMQLWWLPKHKPRYRRSLGGLWNRTFFVGVNEVCITVYQNLTDYVYQGIFMDRI